MNRSRKFPPARRYDRHDANSQTDKAKTHDTATGQYLTHDTAHTARQTPSRVKLDTADGPGGAPPPDGRARSVRTKSVLGSSMHIPGRAPDGGRQAGKQAHAGGRRSTLIAAVRHSRPWDDGWPGRVSGSSWSARWPWGSGQLHGKGHAEGVGPAVSAPAGKASWPVDNREARGVDVGLGSH